MDVILVDGPHDGEKYRISRFMPLFAVSDIEDNKKLGLVRVHTYEFNHEDGKFHYHGSTPPMEETK